MSITKAHKMMVIMTIVSSFGFLLSSNTVNSAFSAAVPFLILIPATNNWINLFQNFLVV